MRPPPNTRRRACREDHHRTRRVVLRPKGTFVNRKSLEQRKSPEPGTAFGRLTATTDKRIGKHGKTEVRCLCECGADHWVHVVLLRNGHTSSCGCINRRGHPGINRTHGMSGTAEHNAWMGIIDRCGNPKATFYRNYGGRGITVCDRWLKSFEAFYADMGPRPFADAQIDRIDNDGNYEPGNCRWATRTLNARNKRNNRLLTHDGHTRTLAEWSEVTGIKAPTIRKRIGYGWSVSRALSDPVDPEAGRFS
jgi:hypothetical protein